MIAIFSRWVSEVMETTLALSCGLDVGSSLLCFVFEYQGVVGFRSGILHDRILLFLVTLILLFLYRFQQRY